MIVEDPLQRAARDLQKLAEEVRKHYVGPQLHIDLTLVALLSRGHLLLEGVPGVAKTTLARTLGEVMNCPLHRIQFTPDLLPTDITGAYFYSQKSEDFFFRKGPLFGHLVLSDEINRAPASTQSALLQAMEERQVTVEGKTFMLPEPFFVIATQNPIEHAGTFPLSDAQIDRFLLRIVIDYPSLEDERVIVRNFPRTRIEVNALCDPDQILNYQALADQIHVDELALDYLLNIVRATRTHRDIALGASPRSALALKTAARAYALLQGRSFVVPDDIRILAAPVLAHRLVLRPQAQLQDLSKEDLVQSIMGNIACLPELERLEY